MEYKTKPIQAIDLQNKKVQVEDTWYSVVGKAQDFLQEVKTGNNTIGFEGEAITYIRGTDASKNPQNPTKQDDMVSFEELLADAYKKDEDFSIKTEMLQVDPEKKLAIFKARITAGEREYEAHGDATAENVGEMVKSHYIRMAETRAIVRVLRWYTNNAKCAKEEI